MTAQKITFSRILFLVLVFQFTSNTLAEECSIDSNNIDRGERKPFFICGSEITSDFALRGLSDANITIDYEQYMGKCTIDDERPGLFLWLKAQENAQTASIKVINRNTDEAFCDELNIDVPQRVVLKEAVLSQSRKTSSSIHLLKIKAGDGQDLSQACEEGILFPEWGRIPSRWPVLSLLSDEEMDDVPSDLRSLKKPLVCKTNSIRALVKVNGQQRDPAKVVVSKVIINRDQEAEGVAFLSLPEPAWASSMKDEDAKFIDVDGIRTRYFEKGKGDALLLIHGGQPTGKAGGALAWVQNFDGLAEDFHVYAVDRLGQGYTDNPKTKSDYEHYYERLVEHVYGFIKAIGLEKVHLVGHSQGGWPVTRLALDHPELISCLVNVDSMAAGGEKYDRHTMSYYRYVTGYVHPATGETAESIRRERELQSYSLNNITRAGAQRGLQLARLPKFTEAEKYFQELQMSPRHPSSRALNTQAHQDIRDGKLKVPSLVIWGYNDPSAPYEGGLALFETINSGATRESRMYVFNKAGHPSFVEYPEEFNSVIKNFCGRY